MINWNIKRRSYLPIGLTIDGDMIRMVQLCLNRDQIEVVEAEKVKVNFDGQQDRAIKNGIVASSISQLLKYGNFRGRNVVSCLPCEDMELASFRLPVNSEEQSDTAVFEEAWSRFGLEPQKDSVKYIVSGNVKQGEETKQEVIMLAAKDQAITEYIMLLERAGLNPVGLETLAFALFRSFRRFLKRTQDKLQTTVLIELGNLYTTVVFCNGDKITFIKKISVGGNDFTEQVAVKLGIDFKQAEVLRSVLKKETTHENSDRSDRADVLAQESVVAVESSLDRSTRHSIADAITKVSVKLANEIALCLRYYTVTFRGMQIENAFISGDEVNENLLVSAIKEQLSCRVEMSNPFRGFDMSNWQFGSDRRTLLCDWNSTVGVALRNYEN